uniref:Zinc-hook domain-containing protein n=1 Tax=Plectus sambesii TaxID=2011161 RepID=A0A914VK30_9BILA
MASFDSLWVQGIRSVGSGDDCAQMIQFQRPLTLITGPNGSGKTTLIEALKYVTAGELPPGKLAAFIHDPKVANKIRVDASVKLEFEDTTGRRCVATRRLYAQIKKQKVECRSDEATIKYTDANGMERSINSKVADFDKEMGNLLGVSKAVLNYVIFCHQEESSWPLGEPKELKTKFDAIFQADRYVKAIESMNKVRKEYTTELKIIQTKLVYMHGDYSEKLKMTRALQKDKQEQASNEERRDELTTGLRPLTVRLNELNGYMESMRLAIQEMEKLKAELSEKSHRLNELQRQIDTPYPGTRSDLEREIRQMKEGGWNVEEEGRRCQEQIDRLKSEMDTVDAARQRLTRQLGMHEANARQRIEAVSQRDELMLSLAKQHRITDFSAAQSPFEEDAVKRFETRLELENSALTAQRNDAESNHRERDEMLVRQLNNCVSETAKVEQTIETKRRDVDRHREEADRIAIELKHIASSQNELAKLDRDIQEQERRFAALEGSFNESAGQGKITALKQQRQQLRDKIVDLENESKNAQGQFTQRNQLEEKRKLRSKIAGECDDIIGRHRATLVDLLGSVPEYSFKGAVEEKTMELTRTRQEKESALRAKDSEVSNWEQKRRSLQQQLTKKEADRSEHNVAILKVTNGDDLDTKLAEVDKLLVKYRNEKGTIEGGKFVYEGYIESVQQRQCCPLCERDYNSANESKKLIDKISRKIKNAPAELTTLERKIVESEELRTKLISVQPIVDLVRNIAETELPELNNSLEEASEILIGLRRERETLENELDRVKRDEHALRPVEADASLVDRHRRTVNDLDAEIEQLTKLLGMALSVRDSDTIQREVEDSRKTLSELEEEVEAKQTALDAERTQYINVKEALNTLRTERLTILEKSHKVDALKTKREEHEVLLKKCAAEEEQARVQLAPFQRKIQDLKADRERIALEYKSRSEEINNAARSLLAAIDQFNSLNANVRRLTQAAADMDRCSDELQQTNDRRDQLSNEKSAIDAKLTAIKEQLDSRDWRMRKLNDHLSLMDLTVRVDELESKISIKQAAFGDKTEEQLSEERRQLIDKIDAINRNVHKLEGSLDELRKKIKEAERRLNEERYRKAGENWRQAKVEEVTVREVIKDLSKYAKALDMAIINYHSSKMEEINAILADLWRRVYKGNDIDCIKIKSEGVEEGEKRRAYNYRVVMSVDGNEIDMRGRCSAGQKVLASILIRLALADVFCLNCGMIALDEPTTNLDFQKVENLAEALNNLITMRSEQANFQLVVITHDERLVEHLARNYRPDFMYGVKKNYKGHTIIRRHRDLDELQDEED